MYRFYAMLSNDVPQGCETGWSIMQQQVAVMTSITENYMWYLLYRRGSRKRSHVVREIVQFTQIEAALRPLDESLSHRQRDASRTKYDTPFVRAARSGEPQLAKSTTPVSLEVRC